MKKDKEDVTNKKWFKNITIDKFERAKFALLERDYADFTKTLMSCKMTKERYYALVKEAILIKEITPLRIVLDSYHTYWSQELFTMIVNWISENQAYNLCSFVDDYIDKVNEYHKSISQWNTHVREKKKRKAEQQAQQEQEQKTFKYKFKRFFKKLFNRKE